MAGVCMTSTTVIYLRPCPRVPPDPKVGRRCLASKGTPVTYFSVMPR
jgi:hypothetical protein